MSQVLKNVHYDDQCYSIIFISVGSDPDYFCFLNKTERYLKFDMYRWKRFALHLQPNTSHAFLVHTYSTQSTSGMGFKPDTHLCSFRNQLEARVFNSAFLLTYQKMLEECNHEDITLFSTRFGTQLLDMPELRTNWTTDGELNEHWLPQCERSAAAIFNKELLEVFGFSYPDEDFLHTEREPFIEIDNWEFGASLFSVDEEDD